MLLSFNKHGAVIENFEINELTVILFVGQIVEATVLLLVTLELVRNAELGRLAQKPIAADSCRNKKHVYMGTGAFQRPRSFNSLIEKTLVPFNLLINSLTLLDIGPILALMYGTVCVFR